MKIEIKKPNRSEYTNIAKLINSAEEIYASIRSPEMMNALGTGKHTAKDLEDGEGKREYLSLYVGEKIVAFVSYRFKNEQTMWVSMLYVNPSEQRKGYGATLLDYVEKLAKKSGILVSVLETDKKAYWSVDFYKKQGYQVLSSEDIKVFPFNKVLNKDPVDGRYLFGKVL